MPELSHAAQAVLTAFNKYPLHGDHIANSLMHGALPAALRAAADQVVPKEWPTIEDYNEYDQGFAAAHIKHRNQILAIADELEAQ